MYLFKNHLLFFNIEIFFSRFGERLRDTQLEKDKRTTRILDKSKIGGAAGGLVTNNVSRKHILANKSLHAGRSNDLNKYSHTHGHGSRMGLNGGNGSQSSVPHPTRPDPAHAHALNGCHTQPLNPHPFLDRNKHKKPNNPEIMKRTLRYKYYYYYFFDAFSTRFFKKIMSGHVYYFFY